tara:strand:+ start:24274 stop:24735 length:462 start_codon:yes stop_codon:yes gene_type:complete
MSFAHPVCLVSTFFGIGLLPIAPGTWGSLVALPVAWVVLTHWNIYFLLLIAASLFVLGCLASEVYVRRTNDTDPGAIVIDEVVGQLLVLAIAPLNWRYFLTAFILFRLADIIKPWPVSWADRSVKGGLGIMLDDLFAALYAAASLYGLMVLFG